PALIVAVLIPVEAVCLGLLFQPPTGGSASCRLPCFGCGSSSAIGTVMQTMTAIGVHVARAIGGQLQKELEQTARLPAEFERAVQKLKTEEASTACSPSLHLDR